jgi:hypothetical protein
MECREGVSLISGVNNQTSQGAHGQNNPSSGSPRPIQGECHAGPQESCEQEGKESGPVIPNRCQQHLQKQQARKVIGTAEIGRTEDRRVYGKQAAYRNCDRRKKSC